MLFNENKTLNFGEINFDRQTAATSNTVAYVSLEDSEADYTLALSSAMHAADMISGLLISLLPVIFLIIILLSVLSTLVCSRIIVSPIERISRISKRMTFPDMTWKCDVTCGDIFSPRFTKMESMDLQNTLQDVLLQKT